MGSTIHPKLFDAATIETVRSAYYDIWQGVEANPNREAAGDDACKSAIIRHLLALVSVRAMKREELVTQLIADWPCSLWTPAPVIGRAAVVSRRSGES